MQTPFNFGEDMGRTVYVKPIKVADLPDELQAQAEGLDRLYAVHNSDGEQLALVADKRMAFVLARQNDLMPVQVH